MTQTIEAGANDVFLVGVVEKAPVFVYSERGYRMLEGMIAVERRSGSVDHLPFVGDEYLIEGMPAGRRFALGGRMHHRDRAKYPLSENRTVMCVETVAPDIDGWPDQNTVKLSGFVCRPPYYRETPFGREICELTIAVPRGNGQQDYIMCLAWGDHARLARNMHVGQRVRASGRFQSREYRKNVGGSYETRTTHEVSLGTLE